jgi:hypothetical protein
MASSFQVIEILRGMVKNNPCRESKERKMRATMKIGREEQIIGYLMERSK